MKEALQPLPEDQWSLTWSPRQAELIHGIALGYLQKGASNMLNAWKAAESHFGNPPNVKEARDHGGRQAN
jgi:hypothetical protein